MGTSSSDDEDSDSLLQATIGVRLQVGEQRYCSKGIRYLPQKSTNLTCSIRDEKYTPGKHRTHAAFIRMDT